MNRIELLKKVREIYEEAESLKMSKNEKSKNHESRKSVSEMDKTCVKDRKV